MSLRRALQSAAEWPTALGSLCRPKPRRFWRACLTLRLSLAPSIWLLHIPIVGLLYQALSWLRLAKAFRILEGARA
jgi:hypothetical protein